MIDPSKKSSQPETESIRTAEKQYLKEADIKINQGDTDKSFELYEKGILRLTLSFPKFEVPV